MQRSFLIGSAAIMGLLMIFFIISALIPSEPKRAEPARRPVAHQPVRQPIQQPQSSQPIVDLPTSILVPRCGNGWATVNIPSGYRVTGGWTTMVANYEWRSERGWNSYRNQVPAGLNHDAARVCAKMPAYANTTMPLTWTEHYSTTPCEQEYRKFDQCHKVTLVPKPNTHVLNHPNVDKCWVYWASSLAAIRSERRGMDTHMYSSIGSIEAMFFLLDKDPGTYTDRYGHVYQCG